MKRSTLKNKADKLWGKRIHERDQSCVVCGSEPAQAHHIIGRKNYRLRWELDNGVLLCPKHHTFDTKFSAHQTPTLFGEWFEENYPERHQFLRDHVNEFWDKDYEKVIGGLNEPST